MSDPQLDSWRHGARKELAGCIAGALTAMAIVTVGLLAWIKYGSR